MSTSDTGASIMQNSRLLIAAATLGLALGAAGCGRDADRDDAAGTTDTTATDTTGTDTTGSTGTDTTGSPGYGSTDTTDQDQSTTSGPQPETGADDSTGG